jgi:DNA-binding NarL/FixJ family response regulator
VTYELDYADGHLKRGSADLGIGSNSPLDHPDTEGTHEMAPLRVMIADDFAMTRHFLRAILESCPAYEVIGMAEDGRSVITMAEASQPDVVTLDMFMPQAYGTSALSGILRAVPGVRVVIVSSIDPALRPSLLSAGATGFVSKQSAPFDFLARLENVLDGSVVDSREQSMQQVFDQAFAHGQMTPVLPTGRAKFVPASDRSRSSS